MIHISFHNKIIGATLSKLNKLPEFMKKHNGRIKEFRIPEYLTKRSLGRWLDT